MLNGYQLSLVLEMYMKCKCRMNVTLICVGPTKSLLNTKTKSKSINWYNDKFRTLCMS